MLDDQLVDLSRGEQRTPDYLALNPTGRTPTLVDGDFVLWESNAIMQYLASGKPNALLPDDARTRADIARWQSWQLAHWGKEACQPLMFERVVKAVFNLGPCDAGSMVIQAIMLFRTSRPSVASTLATMPFASRPAPA